MTHLSLTQTYFALTLGDKKKKTISINSRQGICFIASQILELLSDNTIALNSHHKLITTQALPSEKKYLVAIYDFIKKKEPVKVTTVTDYFTMGLKNRLHPIVEETAQSLIASTHISYSTKRHLMGTTDFYEVNATTLTALTKAINDTTENSDNWSDEEISLILLLDGGKLLKKYVSKDNHKRAKQQIKLYRNREERNIITTLISHYETSAVAVVAAIS